MAIFGSSRAERALQLILAAEASRAGWARSTLKETADDVGLEEALAGEDRKAIRLEMQEAEKSFMVAARQDMGAFD